MYIEFNVNMDLKSAFDSAVSETKTDRISIPCEPSQSKKYRAISDALRDRKKLDLLTDGCREALVEVMTNLENILRDAGVNVETD